MTPKQAHVSNAAHRTRPGRYVAGTSEPPRSHPGDDVAVVVKGRMEVQFFTRSGDALVPDGAPVAVARGDAGYVKSGRIHDARCLADCKLVYVHDGACAFTDES